MRIEKKTLEKVDELKELIMKLDNQRVDFYNEDEGEYMWNGEEIDHGDLNIFNGSAWYYDDEVHVTSIYVEKDKLYFDANWDAYNYKGNNCGDEVMNHLDAEFIVGRYWEESQQQAFIETLEFFISLLKQ